MGAHGGQNKKFWKELFGIHSLYSLIVLLITCMA
jgi:hypothetical protein